MRVYSFTRVEMLVVLRYLLEKMKEEDWFSEALVPIYIDELNDSFFQIRVRLFTSLSCNGEDADDAFRR